MEKVFRSDLSLLTSLFFLSLLLLFFDYLGWVGPVRTALEFVSVPVKYSLFSRGQRVREEISLILRFRSLAEENQELERKLNQALSELSELTELRKENRILREQFQLSSGQDWSTVAAFVIGKDRFLEIDRGQREGVQAGAAVIFKNILVGRVFQVSDHSSSVRLITDPEFKVLARTRNGAQGILSGQYQAGMKLEKVLPETQLNQEELVVARAQEGIPGGLLLGEITKVSEVDSGLFQAAEVKSILEFENLEMVFVTFPE